MGRRLPTEAEIMQVMQDTGMERMQAYNHLVQRFQLQARENEVERRALLREQEEV